MQTIFQKEDHEKTSKKERLTFWLLCQWKEKNKITKTIWSTDEKSSLDQKKKIYFPKI